MYMYAFGWVWRRSHPAFQWVPTLSDPCYLNGGNPFAHIGIDGLEFV